MQKWKSLQLMHSRVEKKSGCYAVSKHCWSFLPPIHFRTYAFTIISGMALGRKHPIVMHKNNRQPTQSWRNVTTSWKEREENPVTCRAFLLSQEMVISSYTQFYAWHNEYIFLESRESKKSHARTYRAIHTHIVDGISHCQNDFRGEISDATHSGRIPGKLGIFFRVGFDIRLLWTLYDSWRKEWIPVKYVVPAVNGYMAHALIATLDFVFKRRENFFRMRSTHRKLEFNHFFPCPFSGKLEGKTHGKRQKHIPIPY